MAIGPLREDHLALHYAHSLLCRAEIFRNTGRAPEAAKLFEQAFGQYSRMQCRWGIVRSWIGSRLTGVDAVLPDDIAQSLEGMDAELLRQFNSTGSVSEGQLSTNLV